jgi:hypothetical protein
MHRPVVPGSPRSRAMNKRNLVRPRPAGRMIEPLEARRLLCSFHIDHGPVVELRPDLIGVERGAAEGGLADIVWVNRGQASDGFAGVFGTNANTARAVVDAVIQAYEQMILSFNYSDGSSTFNLTVSMGGGQGLGGAASTTETLGGKPKAGSLTLQTGNNGSGAGWFIDPSPNEHSEFLGAITNAFSGAAQAGSPAAGNIGDFYTVAAAEVAHCLGLGTNSSLWNNRHTNTNIADNAEGGGIGNFFVFNGASIQHLMTSNNGGANGSDFNRSIHTAGGTGNINFSGTNWRGAEDAGNAVYEFGQRYLVPDTLGLMFKDAYNFSVRASNTRDTFYSVLNTTTGQLTLRGGDDASNDVITVTRNGLMIDISIDIGTDVPGTGALPGAGNLPAFTSSYNNADINSIVINAGDGNDTILIQSIHSGIPVTVNAGNGNDTIHIAEAGGNLDVIDSSITVNGGGGTDILRFFDTSNGFGDTFTINSTSIARTAFPALSYTGLETIIINCGPGASTFNATSTPTGTGVAVFAGDGNDVFNVGQSNSVASLLGSLTLHGQAGSDTVNFNDSASISAIDYTANAGAISRTGIASVGTLTMETVNLNAAASSNTISLSAISSGVSLTVNAGAGDDNLVISSLANIAGTLVYNGDAGTDTLTINDTANASNATHTISQNAYSRTSFAGFTFNTTEAIVLSGGNGSNTYNIDPTPVSLTAAVTINAGSGGDAFRITPTANNAQFVGGTLTLNGGGGSDSFTLFDSSSSAAMPYTISTSSIVRGVQTMNYSSVETMTFHGTSGNNDFAVASLAASTSATLNGNSGNDRLFMGGVAQNLDNVAGSVVFNGGAGTDTVELRDQQNSRNDTYTIQSTSFTRPSFGPLTLSTIEGITVQGGSGNNTFQLLATTAGVPVSLHGNGGADHFAIGGSVQANIGTNFASDITVDGGDGSDTVTIFDSNGSGTHTYTLLAGTFDKTDFSLLTYGTVESFTLQANVSNNTINIESLDPGMSCLVHGNGGNDTFNLALASSQLNSLPSPITINGGAGIDQILLFDGSNSGGAAYTVTSNQITRPGFGGLTYGGSNANESAFVSAGTGNDTFDVQSVSIPVTLAGGNGNDEYTVGGGDVVTNITALARLLGGGGADRLTVNDSTTSAANSYTFDESGFSVSGSTNVSPDSIESFVVNGSQGGNTFTVRQLASGAAVTLNGNGGNDMFSLGSTTNSVEPLDGTITIDGGAGSDTVNIRDQAELLALGFTISDTTVTRTGMGAVSYAGISQLNVHSGGGAGKVHTVNSTAAGTQIRVSPGSATDTINVVETHPTGLLFINPSGGNDTVNVNASGVGSATVLFDATVMTLGTLNVGVGGLARLAADGARVLRTNNLTVNGVLDLVDNAMIVDYSGASPLSTVRNSLASGYAGGAWNGNGIHSAAAAANPGRALGYAEASALFSSFPAIFAGQQVDNTSVLVRYTRYGDASLDGQVNLADFNRLAAGFGSGTLWSQGNFNYDNTVNLSDFNLLAANFGGASDPDSREISDLRELLDETTGGKRGAPVEVE